MLFNRCTETSTDCTDTTQAASPTSNIYALFVKEPLPDAPAPPPGPEPAAKLMMVLILLMLRMVIVMQVIAAAAAPSSEEGASQTEMIGESVARHGVVGPVKRVVAVVVVVAGVRARAQSLSEAVALGLSSPQYPGRVCMCRVMTTAAQKRQVLDVLVHARSQYFIRHVRTKGVGERGGLLFLIILFCLFYLIAAQAACQSG